jgi:hypothetical protein
LSSGNRRCPICKAAVTPPISEFAVNVVLRDTIERLYPHILLRRAVDDIQAAQRSGIKELRSVIRWLHNFPQTPEVVHAVIAALTYWVRDMPDCVENRVKIIRDGHIAILCRIFSIVDVNSSAFADLLLALRLIASPYPMTSTPPQPLSSACQKVMNASTGSMLSADIHVELMRILSHKSIKLASEKDCFELLMILLKGLEDSQTQLRRFLHNSYASPEPLLSPPPIRRLSDGSPTPNPLLKTPPRGCLASPEDSFPVSVPMLTPSRSEKKEKEDRLLLLMRLISDRIPHELFVEQIFSVFIRLLTLSSFSFEEQHHHATLLVASGIVETLNSCLLHYMTLFESPLQASSHPALYKLIVFLAKLSFRVNDAIRVRLNQTCLQYCVRILRSWNHPSAIHFCLSCEVLFSTCEALCALMFTSTSPVLLSTSSQLQSWRAADIAPQTLGEIVQLLDYRARLHTFTPTSTFRCPQLICGFEGQVKVRVEEMFGLIRLPSQQQPHPSLIQICPSAPVERRAGQDDENESSEPLLPFIMNSLQRDHPFARISTEFSLSLNLSSRDISPHQPTYLLITRACDLTQFRSWVSESPQGTNSSDPNLLPFPSFPFVRVDLRTGTILRSGVTPYDTSKSMPQSGRVEELMPLSVMHSNKKSFKIDVASNHLLLNVNGIQSSTFIFPPNQGPTASPPSGLKAERSEEEKLTTEEDDDERSVESTSSPVRSDSFEDQESAERFLSSVIAAVANERRIIAQTLLSHRPSRVQFSQSVASSSTVSHEQQSGEEEHETSDDSTLSLWILSTSSVCGADEEEAKSAMIFLTSEIETLHDEDFEEGPHPTKLIHLPMIWEKIDDRFLRSDLGKGRLLFSTTQNVCLDKISEVTALSSLTVDGVHIYNFQVLNQASCVVGLCSSDGPPSRSLHDLPLTLISLLYHSNGLIQLVVPTGSHPCALLREGNPLLEGDDSVAFVLSQEDEGSVRIFHNHQLVYRLENLYQYICPGTPLGAFVSLSKPGAEVSVDHYLQRDTSTAPLCDSIDWKWLKDCFHSFHRSFGPEPTEDMATNIDDCQTLEPTFYAHSDEPNPFKFFSTIASFTTALDHFPFDLVITPKLIDDITSVLSTAHEHFDLCPQFCSSTHSSEMIETAVLSTWSVRCPIAYDFFVSFVALFSSIQRLCFLRKYYSPFDPSLAALKRKLIQLGTCLITKGSFKPRDLLNAGVAHQFASYLSKSVSIDDQTIVSDLLVFLRTCLNHASDSSLQSFAEPHGLSHIFLSSGLILKLSQIAFTMLKDAKEQPLARQIAVVVCEVMARLNSHHQPTRIADDWTPALSEKRLTVRYEFFSHESLLAQYSLFLVSIGKWHHVLAAQMEGLISLKDFTSPFIDSFLALCGNNAHRPLSSICFDHRTQSNAHIWLSKVRSERSPTVSKGRNIPEVVVVEIVPDIVASSGDPSTLLLSDPSPSNYWMSGPEDHLPHWFGLKVDHCANWKELQILCPLDVTFHPNALRISVGSEPGKLFCFREMHLSVSPEWQPLLLKSELITIGLESSDLYLRVEILNNISFGSTSRVDGLRLVDFPPTIDSPIPLQQMVRRNVPRARYQPRDWIEGFYFDLLDDNLQSVESRLLANRQLHRQLFAGYGPWMWGHPGNNGFVALLVPCTVSSAISQMLLAGFCSVKIQQVVLQACRKFEVERLEHHPLMPPVDPSTGDGHEDPSETINSVASQLAARYSRTTAQLIALNPAHSSYHHSISTAVATIEAIRSLVREEQIRMIRISNRTSDNPEALQDSTGRMHSTPLPGSGGSRVQGFTPHSPDAGASGSTEFLYPKADGTIACFDASYEACAPYGLLHSQTVRSHRYADIGTGIVIGVHENKLWIHLEKNRGATSRDDNWQYADLYAISPESYNLTSISKQVDVVQRDRAVQINDRVRRGPNWRYHNQDVYAGNLGTVIGDSGRGLWVLVTWDGGDTNTYRWGAEGCHDLEIVETDSRLRSSLQLALQEKDSETLVSEIYNQPSGISINESLTTEEQVRCFLWRGINYAPLITGLYDYALVTADEILASRCRQAMMAIAEYSIESARSLNLNLKHVSGLMLSVLSDDLTTQLCSAQFLSLICASGLIYELVLQPTHQHKFPLREIVSLIKSHGPCSQLLLSSLRFLRDIAWLCLDPSTHLCLDSTSQEIFQFKPSAHFILPGSQQRPESELIASIHSLFSDPLFLETLFEILIPIFNSQQSSSALLLTLDMFSYLIRFPHCVQLLISKNIALHLVNFSKDLLGLQMTPSLKMIFHQLMSLMLAIESHVNESLPSLLSTILVFADIARDYHTILQTMQMNESNASIMCRCVEILLGGRRRYRNKRIPSPNWRGELTVGDRIDAKDKSQLWYEAIVKNTDNAKAEVFVHYIGWGTKYDEWIPISSDRLQLLHSETGYWRDNLRLDDPVEILCIHSEGSEIKRRWFRGIVARMNERSDKLLVEYDKRGSHEERWVSISYDEEICKVGTHVPSALGSMTDILKTLRKKQLLECNSLRTVVQLLRNLFQSSVEITRACLETVQYLINPDGQATAAALVNRHLQPVIDELASLLCQCIEIYSKKSEEVTFDGSQPTPAEDIVEIASDIIATLATIPVFDATATAMETTPTTTENPNQSQVFSPPFLLAYSNASRFVEALVSCGGDRILMDLLISYGKILDIRILTSTLSTFGAIIRFNGPWSSSVVAFFVGSRGIEIVTDLANMLTATKSSARLVSQCLTLLQHLAEASLEHKLKIFHLHLHETCIRCVTSFPHQPRVLAASLGLLASIISRDGRYTHPQTLTSSGPFNFDEMKHSDKYLTAWRSADRVPTLDHPHWIEIPVAHGRCCRVRFSHSLSLTSL